MKFFIKDFFSKFDQILSFLVFGHIYWRNPYWKASIFVLRLSLPTSDLIQNTYFTAAIWPQLPGLVSST